MPEGVSIGGRTKPIPGVIEVYPGGACETVQDGADEAAKTGTDTNPVLVKNRTLGFDAVSEPGVLIDSPAIRALANAELTGLDSQLPIKQPHRGPLSIPAPSVLCIHSADCDASWFAVMAATLGANMTPLNHASRCGVVVTHGVTYDTTTDTIGAWTAEQMRAAVELFGNELDVHGDNIAPTDTEMARAKLLRAKHLIEAAIHRPVRGCWSDVVSTAQMGTGDTYVALMNALFEWTWNSAFVAPDGSVDLLPQNGIGCPGRSHLFSYTYQIGGPSVSSGTTTEAKIAQILERLAMPGGRTMIAMHGLTETAGGSGFALDIARWKQLCDGIATLVASGRLIVTTVGGYMDAVLSHAVHSATGVFLPCDWGGHPLDHPTTAMAPFPAATEAGNVNYVNAMAIAAGGTITVEAVGAGGEPWPFLIGSKCIQVATDADAGTRLLCNLRTMPQNAPVTVRFAARVAAGTGALLVNNLNNGLATTVKKDYAYTLTTDWKTIMLTIGADSEGADGNPSYVDIWCQTGNTTYQITGLQMVAVGVG